MAIPNQDACDPVNESDSFVLCSFLRPVSGGITAAENTKQNPLPINSTASNDVAKNYDQRNNDVTAQYQVGKLR